MNSINKHQDGLFSIFPKKTLLSNHVQINQDYFVVLMNINWYCI